MGTQAAQRYRGPATWLSPVNTTLTPKHGCDLFVPKSCASAKEH